MIRKEIEYDDYFDNHKKGVFYFGFKKSELTMMETTAAGGLENQLRNIVETDNNEEIMKFFERIILDSYGIKSDDGMRFMKTEEIRQAFYESPAYDVLFMELLSDTNKAIEFVRGIMPKGINITEEDINKTAESFGATLNNDKSPELPNKN